MTAFLIGLVLIVTAFLLTMLLGWRRAHNIREYYKGTKHDDRTP